MAGPSNLSFETAGSGAGVALGWTLTATATVEEWADYQSASLPWEAFEGGWANDTYLFAFAVANLSGAQYGTVKVSTIKLVEDFAELWQGNESYLTEMPGQVESAPYGTSSGLKLYEPFGNAWLSSTFKSAFAADGSDVTSNGPETFTTWVPSYKTSFTGIGTDLTRKTFASTNADTAETFERVQQRVQVGVDVSGGLPSSSLVVANSGTHRFPTGAAVTFAGDVLPSNIAPGVTYYVVGTPTTTKFQVSASPGGTALSFSQSVSGTFYASGDPAVAWVDMMTSI